MTILTNRKDMEGDIPWNNTFWGSISSRFTDATYYVDFQLTTHRNYDINLIYKA